MNANRVEYLLIGGYAVNIHGYPRSTGDLDIWIAARADNAERLVKTLGQFGFTTGVGPHLFLEPGRITRMGHAPLRIEILNSISGVEFSTCFARRQLVVIDGVPVNVISLADLKTNKKSAGRAKDTADLENLP